MEAKLIDIGTSKGIRIPATVLKSFETIPESFEIHVNEHQIILEVKEQVRMGWKEKFQKYDDAMLIDETLEIEKLNEL